MTLVDRAIPFWVWFVLGFGILSMFIGIANVGMIAVTMLTVKGIDIPSWVIVVSSVAIVIACTAVGWFFEKYKVWDRYNRHQNENTNSDIGEMRDAIRRIEAKLDGR